MSGRKSTASTPQQLANIQVQTSSAGQCIPIVWGTARIACNLIGYYDFQAIAQKSQASGKGGGSQVTGYDYKATVLLALCEGPVKDITRCWQGKDQVAMSSAAQVTANGQGWMASMIAALTQVSWAKFTGQSGQSPWSYLQSRHPDQAIGYSNTAYIGAANYDLGSGAAMPNNNFEVVSNFTVPGQPDANPKDVLVDFLTNTLYGVPGWQASHIGDLTQYSNYCLANSLLVSPALDTQVTASQFVQDLSDATNSLVVWSEGKLKMVPRGDSPATGNGVTYTPNTTVIYSLTDDHFLTDGGQDPVRLIRSRPADAYNRFPVEYLDRSSNYNIDVVEARDTGSIYLYGHRKASPKQLHMVCNAATAMQVAQIEMQRQLYVRNTYQFDLPWNFALLEAGDLVELTDAKLGLNADPVMITAVEENNDGMLTFTAEEWPFGVNSQVLYSTQSRNGYTPMLNAPAGNVNAPVIFEPPDQLAGDLELWMAVNGAGNWGGCDVYVSQDNATYKFVGTIDGSARSGVLTAALPSGSDPDTTDTLAVDISQIGGQLLSGSQADADQFNTLCYVDGELVSYETATLTGTGKYNLTYLRRGAYGSLIGSHLAGSQFARLDEAIFKYPFAQGDIGKNLYIKFVSFNSTGGGRQDLASVQPYQYKIQGTALLSPLPAVQNLVSVYKNNQTMLHWDPVTDFRSPLQYEVRKGTSPQTAEVLGATYGTDFPSMGDGNYWVAAKYGPAYSSSWTEIIISGATLVQNVIATFDEYASGWQGTLSGGAGIDDIGELILGGAGDIGQVGTFSSLSSVRFYGGIQPSGFYEIPAGHRIDIGNAAPCNISATYTLASSSPYNTVGKLPDFAAATSIIGAYAGKSDVRVQIAIAGNNGMFGAWQDFVPGVYVGRIFKFGLALTSADPNVTAIINGFKFSVDVPDRIDTMTNVNVPTGGVSLLYSTPFHGGANGAMTPAVQITILNAQPGDTVVLSSQTLSGFTVQVTNGGSGVSRNINATIKGY